MQNSYLLLTEENDFPGRISSPLSTMAPGRADRSNKLGDSTGDEYDEDVINTYLSQVLIPRLLFPWFGYSYS